jgi:DNA-binding NtrC family response regulator
MGSSWVLEDCESTNGTFVNGKREDRVVLSGGELVDAGRVLLRVHPSYGAPPGAPSVSDVSPCSTGHPTLDPVLHADLERAGKLATAGVPIVLTGQSGTGKEVLARWLHERMARPGQLVAVNCGAIPATLLESHMFGHVKGAFSGAVRSELGFVRAASGGTLFLDEIGDLPKPSQAALLRVLQDGEVTPVGSTHTVKVDLRVVSATHHSLGDLVARVEFRRDLFARIAGFTVTLPSLEDRLDDLGIIIGALVQRIAGGRATELTFSIDAARALFAYPWPFNIRELQRALETCNALAADGRVRREHLPEAIATYVPPSLPPAVDASSIGAIDERLRLELFDQLSRHRGNIAAVARAMGKAPMQIHRWCKRFGLEPGPFRR